MATIITFNDLNCTPYYTCNYIASGELMIIISLGIMLLSVLIILLIFCGFRFIKYNLDYYINKKIIEHKVNCKIRNK